MFWGTTSLCIQKNLQKLWNCTKHMSVHVAAQFFFCVSTKWARSVRSIEIQTELAFQHHVLRIQVVVMEEMLQYRSNDPVNSDTTYLLSGAGFLPSTVSGNLSGWQTFCPILWDSRTLSTWGGPISTTWRLYMYFFLIYYILSIIYYVLNIMYYRLNILYNI